MKKNDGCLLQQYRKAMNNKNNTNGTEERCTGCSKVFLKFEYHMYIYKPITYIKTCEICDSPFCCFKYKCNIHDKIHNCLKEHTRELFLCHFDPSSTASFTHDTYRTIVCNDCYSNIDVYKSCQEDGCCETNFWKLCESIEIKNKFRR